MVWYQTCRWKKLRQTVVLMTLFFGMLQAKAQSEGALRFSQIAPWKVKVVDLTSPLAALVNYSEMLLVLDTSEKNQGSTAVFVHKVFWSEDAKPKSNPEDWRPILRGQSRLKPIILREEVLQRNGQHRYIVEYETQLGPDSKSRSIMMATFVDGEQLYVFSYTNHEAVFAMDAPYVRKLLQSLIARLN